MNSNHLRQAFLDYFANHKHQIVSSSSLVPQNDPSLLFTNAGMVQFKNAFLGTEKRPYTRACSSQRCVRAGGKHNDLDNVGYTARHHTFFEMLGNFSFGDYFKREAIQYAWDFLTNTLGLPAERLWITVYTDDKEAEDIWLNEMKVSNQRFSRCGESDNFWSMGDTGPCGPCTEIFYDHGPDVEGGPPGSPDQEGDRYVEVWNLVFMQYNRSADGTLNDLPKPSVDTGMGLERLAAVMQGVKSNYDTDLFTGLLQKAANLAKLKTIEHPSLRVIADHIRSTSFLILDGVSPSNEGRGYVLRRIIRRAVRHGEKLGIKQAFFYKLVPTLVEQMGKAYPELAKCQTVISDVLKEEEDQFAKTLEIGLRLLEKAIAEVHTREIPGEVIFKLYDTYGFPVDLTADIAREQDLHLDYAGFELCMDEQRRLSKSASQFVSAGDDQVRVEVSSDFTGYECTQSLATIKALVKDKQSVDCLKAGEMGVVILDSTPFYPEGGGQMGDSGEIITKNFKFKVFDTQKQGDAILHKGEVTQGECKVGDRVNAQVNELRRQAIRLNHSATHLLHAALRQVLGEHVTQKGSLVAPERLRFDFSHTKALTAEQLTTIENLVNDQIRLNHASEISVMTPEEAIEKGALALFGERYAENIRVLRMGDFSMEVCGGIHVDRTGDIGFFKITTEEGIASGIRRIEAVTGADAVNLQRLEAEKLSQIGQVLKTGRDESLLKVKQVVEQNRQLQKQIEQLQAKMSSLSGSQLVNQAQQVDDIKVLAVEIPNANTTILRATMDDLKQKLKTAAIVLASVDKQRVTLIAGITKDCTDRLNAGELVNYVATQVGGKGGGRADMAQAGGTEPQHLEQALQSVTDWVKEQVK